MRGYGPMSGNWRARRGYSRGAGFSRAGYWAALWIRRIVMAAYVLIGLIVADAHHYLAGGHLHSIKGIAEAVLAVLLWPLIVFGVSMRF